MTGDKEIGERLATARRAAGFESAAAAARALGIAYPTYAGHENGSRGVRANLEKYARKYGVSTDWLLTERGPGPSGTESRPEPRAIPSGQLAYGGPVSAGYFLSVDEFNQDLEHFAVPPSIPRHPSYPDLEQAAYPVKGDSMNEAGILDGMWAVAAKYADWVDKIGELDNGNNVIVQRARASGSEIERTVKEVQFARRGMRLIPRSNNPVHKEFFIDLDAEADTDVEEVTIIGVVLWVGRDMDPRSK